MSKIMEEMRNEYAKEYTKVVIINVAIRMIKSGKIPLEDIADYTELLLDTLKELESEIMNKVMVQKAIKETIRICKDRNVLREYLEEREKEVEMIMMNMFDKEQIMKSFIQSERHDEARETAERLIKKGKMTLEDIADCVPSLSFDELKELEAEIMQMA